MGLNLNEALFRANLARREFERREREQAEAIAAEQRKHDNRCGAFDGKPIRVEPQET